MLIVDDEAIIRRVARQVLELAGYVVLEAASGWEALTVFGARGSSLGLVLTDGSMPDMDGWELARILAVLCPELTVVVMPGYAAALPSGPHPDATAVLEKPFTAGRLIALVRSVLS